MAEIIDKRLQNTHYGFSKNRSTADAIHLIRRAIEYYERAGRNMLTVLLDWERAFDKVTRPGLFSALERLNVPENYINIIKSMYNGPEFRVELEGHTSKWYKQYTGISQGCPLSPFLFSILLCYEKIKWNIIFYFFIYHNVM